MGLSKSVNSSPPDLPPVCRYDPYTNTHTIIRVTVKKRQQLTPRFATCMYVRPIYQHSHHHKSNCQKASLACPQIWDLYVLPIYQHSHHHKGNRQRASPANPRFGTSMYDPYTNTHTIIRVTAKKLHLLPPDLGPLCMTHIPTLTPS